MASPLGRSMALSSLGDSGEFEAFVTIRARSLLPRSTCLSASR